MMINYRDGYRRYPSFLAGIPPLELIGLLVCHRLARALLQGIALGAVRRWRGDAQDAPVGVKAGRPLGLVGRAAPYVAGGGLEGESLDRFPAPLATPSPHASRSTR
jgi:hypothetical protein